MRKLAFCAATLLCASEASAADYLRGSVYDPPPRAERPYYNWEGVYIGGQVGYAENYVDFGPGTRSMVANLLRQTVIENEAKVSGWTLLPPHDARGASYGGFVGYNSQWGEAVLGVEANYNATSIQTASTDVIARRYTTSDNITYDGVVTSKAAMKLTDYGTLRFRAGYAWDWFMPYLTAGVAVGRADLMRSATVDFVNRTDNSTSPATSLGPIRYSADANRKGALTIGYAAGLGVDIGLFPGVFLRGEYEFVQLNTLGGMTARINTVRTAAAVKF